MSCVKPTNSPLMIGVLSLQGSIEEHINHIATLGHIPIKVKTISDLDNLDRLILPGGESTTIANILRSTNLLEPLKNKIANGLKVWGTCAGMILLAKDIDNTLVTSFHPELTTDTTFLKYFIENFQVIFFLYLH